MWKVSLLIELPELEQAPETTLIRSVRYPLANAVLEVNVKVLVFFLNKYVHARKATNETSTGEKELYQIPGTYLVRIIERAKKRIVAAVHG